MVEIQIEYEGNLRCSATHMESGTILITDAPKDNQGLGSSFSPTDLVATALGTCMLTIMGITARKMQLDFSEAKVRVIKEMTATPPRKIARLSVRFDIPLKLTDEQKQQLENAANACPVCRSLDPEVQRAVEFHWG
jgi:putative redox protein